LKGEQRPAAGGERSELSLSYEKDMEIEVEIKGHRKGKGVKKVKSGRVMGREAT